MTITETREETETLVFLKDVPVPMSDGNVLRANVFLPKAPGRYPVVLSHGIYGKDAHFRDAFAPQWAVLKRIYPGLDSDGSTGRFLRWETPDPERWVPHGYVIVSVDGRGSGKSPGYLDPFSARETVDHAEIIDWAGTQDWSTGKVGLLGVSYFAIKQWQVAALRPKHLSAMIPWEGASDHYRDFARHGGILANGFTAAWMPRQVLVNQHGNADTTLRDPDTGARTTGPAIAAEILAGNVAPIIEDLRRHPLDDAWYRERSPDLARVEVPVLSAGNWGGPGLHLRGNLEGFQRAGSRNKYLSMHIGTHYESFYLPPYVEMQRHFFDRFLKGDAAAFDAPPVRLEIRRADGTATVRHAREWPLPGTRWVDYQLGADGTLAPEGPVAAGALSFAAMRETLSFLTAPFADETEFTGPLSVTLHAGSTSSDLDIFATLHLIDAGGSEVRFIGAHEQVPVARGWLRASQRRLDPEKSRPGRPWHSHECSEPLTPGEICELEVELWPTSVVCPAGSRLELRIAGRDQEYEVPGRMRHDDDVDRPAHIFDATTRLVISPQHRAFLRLPRIE
ncbi:MAG: CocE/NonD family hydrolase [Rhodobacteraceae bacterium]|nr:CocE/NonD family hydrolase [Paracoccaceae bacterium]